MEVELKEQNKLQVNIYELAIDISEHLHRPSTNPFHILFYQLNQPLKHIHHIKPTTTLLSPYTNLAVEVPTMSTATKSSLLNNLATKAKAHHNSLNAAYEVYYSGGVSPRPSLRAQHNSTSAASSSSESSNMSKAWTSFKKAAKEHHEGLNAAYATYYGGGAMPVSSEMVTPRTSSESTESLIHEDEKVYGESVGTNESSASGMKKALEKAKKIAKEHHRSVNTAYESYYGGGAIIKA